MKSRILKRTPNKKILKIIEANGSYIKDQKGKSYLDMASNAMICNLGYNHHEIKNTIKNSYKKLSYCHNGSFSHNNQELLAHRLNSLLKEDYYVYFCNSGSETIEAAIRFVYLYQKTLGYSNRKKLVAFEESYHGSSLGALSITGANAVREKWGDITTNVQFIGRNPSNNTVQEVLNDDIGGFFVEPLSSNATGTIEYPAKSLENIYLKLKKNRQLIVFDEISTSIGRTGTNFFFEQQNLSFSPDIICTSKGLGVGYFNIGAVLVKKEVADNLMNSETPLLGHSYNGHPVGTAIGLKVIEILERDNYLKKIEMNSNYLNTNIQKIIEPIEGVEFNHRCLLSSIHTNEDFMNAGVLHSSLLREGVITLPSSKNHITIAPTFITEKKDFDLFLEKFERTLKKYV